MKEMSVWKLNIFSDVPHYPALKELMWNLPVMVFLYWLLWGLNLRVPDPDLEKKVTAWRGFL